MYAVCSRMSATGPGRACVYLRMSLLKNGSPLAEASPCGRCDGPETAEAGVCEGAGGLPRPAPGCCFLSRDDEAMATPAAAPRHHPPAKRPACSTRDMSRLRAYRIWLADTAILLPTWQSWSSRRDSWQRPRSRSEEGSAKVRKPVALHQYLDFFTWCQDVNCTVTCGSENWTEQRRAKINFSFLF